MISLKNLSTKELDILCNDAGLDMENTHILRARFVEFSTDCAKWLYQVVASDDGDNGICICELAVHIDSNGDLGADFAGTPLFESNDMEAVNDVFNEGAVRLDKDFNPLDLVGIPSINPLDDMMDDPCGALDRLVASFDYNKGVDTDTAFKDMKDL